MVFIITLFATFFFMEFVAWFSHKYIMHGFLWKLHKDHHIKNPENKLEKNDSFFVIFALPAIILIITGIQLNLPLFIASGLGITLYGLCYFIVHDVFIHQRVSWLKRTNNSYFKAIRKAHKVHHKHLNKENGECFGMLVVPYKYFRDAFNHSTIS